MVQKRHQLGANYMPHMSFLLLDGNTGKETNVLGQNLGGELHTCKYVMSAPPPRHVSEPVYCNIATVICIDISVLNLTDLALFVEMVLEKDEEKELRWWAGVVGVGKERSNSCVLMHVYPSKGRGDWKGRDSSYAGRRE